MNMVPKGVTPYSYNSFVRQIKVLKEELKNLGIITTEEEILRLSFLSRRKYERYDHFLPGESFDNRLINWLGQFDEEDRQSAIYVIKCLKFISEYEMRELAIQTFEHSKQQIIKEIKLDKKDYCYNHLEYINIKLTEELDRSIYVAGVDDISFDFFRRYAMNNNKDVFIKDNFVEYYKRDMDSLNDLPSHNRIFLLDQLSGSGTTAIRKEEDEWAGKIPTIFKIWGDEIKNNVLYYTPYLLSIKSLLNLKERIKLYIEDNPKNKIVLNPTCILNISPCLSNENGDDVDESKPVAKLCKKYYEYFEPDKHTKKGGSAVYGYGRAGLTLIIQANCPNNSIPILWHDDNGWYPLFPRVDHHRG